MRLAAAERRQPDVSERFQGKDLKASGRHLESWQLCAHLGVLSVDDRRLRSQAIAGGASLETKGGSRRRDRPRGVCLSLCWVAAYPDRFYAAFVASAGFARSRRHPCTA